MSIQDVVADVLGDFVSITVYRSEDSPTIRRELSLNKRASKYEGDLLTALITELEKKGKGFNKQRFIDRLGNRAVGNLVK